VDLILRNPQIPYDLLRPHFNTIGEMAQRNSDFADQLLEYQAISSAFLLLGSSAFKSENMRRTMRDETHVIAGVTLESILGSATDLHKYRRTVLLSPDKRAAYFARIFWDVLGRTDDLRIVEIGDKALTDIPAQSIHELVLNKTGQWEQMGLDAKKLVAFIDHAVMPEGAVLFTDEVDITSSDRYDIFDRISDPVIKRVFAHYAERENGEKWSLVLDIDPAALVEGGKKVPCRFILKRLDPEIYAATHDANKLPWHWASWRALSAVESRPTMLGVAQAFDKPAPEAAREIEVVELASAQQALKLVPLARTWLSGAPDKRRVVFYVAPERADDQKNIFKVIEKNASPLISVVSYGQKDVTTHSLDKVLKAAGVDKQATVTSLTWMTTTERWEKLNRTGVLGIPLKNIVLYLLDIVRDEARVLDLNTRVKTAKTARKSA
jgi:hypothetical protein